MMQTSRDCLFNMFKIKFLKLFGEEKLLNSYSFAENNYYFANNNLGKTLLMIALDYMLGSSSLKDFFDREGMTGIAKIELHVETSNGLYVFVRTKEHQFYKLSDEGVLQTVDLKTYKEKITESLVQISNHEMEEYKYLFGEELSFRSLSFLNFIDEIGLGDIANVFTRQHQIKHIFRITSIFDFLFNYRTMEEKLRIEKEIAEKDKQLEKLLQESTQYYNALGELNNLLTKYNLDFKEDIEYLKKCIALIRLDTNDEKKAVQSGKLYELIKKIHEVSNEIKEQELLQAHSDSVLTRSSKTKHLISEFKDLLSGTQLQSDYIKEIETIFADETRSQSILLSKDYKKTIQSLRNEKKTLENELARVVSKSELHSLEERLADAELSLKYYRIIADNSDNSFVIKSLRESLNTLKLALKGLCKKENVISEKINQIINDLYLNDSNIKFVKEDKLINGFGIVFNYKTLSVCGKKVVNNVEKYYLPGSLAKMTSWQVCTYLALLKYIIGNRNLPVLPVLCIDGLYQPFDNTSEGYPELLKLIIESAKECGIQVIITATEYNENLNQVLNNLNVQIVNLNSGFNSAYKKGYS